MSLPNGAYHDHIRHTLYCKHKQPLVITDPIGYETSDEEFTRTFKNIGIISNFSTNLKFVNDGLDFIEDVAFNYGLNEIISLKKEGRNLYSDEWEEYYTSTLDLTTFNKEKGELSVKINSGGLDKIFKARESEKIEIESTKTIDGVDIPSLKTKNLITGGREIFLKSTYDIKSTDNNAFFRAGTNDRNIRGVTASVPLNLKNQSHDNAQSQTPNTAISANSTDRSESGVNGLMFFANADRQRNLNLDLDITFTPYTYSRNMLWFNFWVRIAIYKDGAAYKYDRNIPLFYSTRISDLNNIQQNIQYNGLLVLKEGESASLQFSMLIKGTGGSGTTSVSIDCKNISADMTISEDSKFQPSYTQMLLMHDLGERLSLLITGKSNVFKSNILGIKELGYNKNGEWGYLGTYSGHWLRGFQLQDEENEELRYKRYTTSFKDYSETLKSILNVHIGFQTINGKEEIIAEDFNYFFNPNIVIVLKNPLTNVKRYVAEDLIFSAVETGYEKGGTVEDILGLDEPNGKSNWVSNMTGIKNTYTVLSKYIAGVYAEEKQRRYQKETNPTLDRDLDGNIFLKDCKYTLGKYQERTWKDDFSQAPTGIFSPDTTKNLRLSPANNLRRHGSLLATPLKHYQDMSLAFGSSTANSGMSTKLIGRDEIKESEDILNANLGNRRFEPFYIEGEHKVNIELAKKLKGHTRINGINVPNFYCKVQFTIENDPTLRYGYIMSVKPDGAGKFKLIEASN